MWATGRPLTTSERGSHPGTIPPAAVGASRLRWVSCAPFGFPVVPEV